MPNNASNKSAILIKTSASGINNPFSRSVVAHAHLQCHFAGDKLCKSSVILLMTIPPCILFVFCRPHHNYTTFFSFPLTKAFPAPDYLGLLFAQ